MIKFLVHTGINEVALCLGVELESISVFFINGGIKRNLSRKLLVAAKHPRLGCIKQT